MAYDQLAQADRDAFSEESRSIVAAFPPPQGAFRPISMEFDNLGGTLSMEPRNLEEQNGTRLGSTIRSMTSTGTSYDMIEDDDYEETHTTLKRSPNIITNHNQEKSSVPEPQIPSTKEGAGFRTASIGQKLPLKYPTPGLQSVQGAYTKNVERLEESAERLSLTSSLEDELQKMKFEQRRLQRQTSAPTNSTSLVHHTSRQVSITSLSNSIVGVDTSAGSVPRNTISSKGSLSTSFSHLSRAGPSASKSSRFTQPLPDQDRENRVSEYSSLITASAAPPQPPPHAYQPGSWPRQPSADHIAQGEDAKDTKGADEVRPSTAASNDTYRQATTLFRDFDGVHYISHSHLSPSRQVSANRRVAINQPPLASDAAAFKEPPPGESMVYYPAPVPMMLNLPQKLSKLPSAAERERRRLKALSGVPTEMRKSAPWLTENGNAPPLDAPGASQRQSAIPMHLRASAFFDHPGIGKEVDIKGASAVKTLDSILDASALAPVSAFTDHPFAGQLGGEVYGTAKEARKSATLDRKENRRGSLSNILRTSTGLNLNTKVPRPGSFEGLSTSTPNKLVKRQSRINVNESEAALATREEVPLTTSEDKGNGTEELALARERDANGEDVERAEVGEQEAKQQEEEEEAEQGEEEEEEEEEEETEEAESAAYGGPPTTLLAELQMRKAQQKMRNRTAANAFPNGMHSTLLELDAVAQVQQKSRKKKHVTLAWEDQENADPEGFDDDDVPLGLLVAGQKLQQNINRPMGLMEKRDMEDNEPLSRRRARLRGDGTNRLASGPSDAPRASTMYTLEMPGLTDRVLEEQEGETLAQRVQRLKAEKGIATSLGAEFTQEVSSQLGLKTENVPPAMPETEESLAQRRKRLREEAPKTTRQASGASLQNALGVKVRSSMADILHQRPAAAARQPSSESKCTGHQVKLPRSSLQPDLQFSQMPPVQQPMMSPFMAPGMLPSYPTFNAGMPQMNGMSGFSYNTPMMYSPGLAMQAGGFGQSGYMHDPMMMGPPLDPKQRDMIDQWRQGVGP